MLRFSSTKLGTLILLSTCSTLSIGHPTTLENDHLHNSTTVKWSKNPQIKDGSVPHNHIVNQQFGAYALPGETPFDVYACWDDKNWQYSTKIGNNHAHCFIGGSTAVDGTAPTFRFTGSHWNNERKDMVRDAIEAWEATFAFGYDVGLNLVEVPSSTSSDIQIRWTTDSAQSGWWADDTVLRFDHNLDWSYVKSATGAAANKWHFWTIVLHEVGHVLGFDHTTQPNSVMNLYIQNGEARVGRPKNEGGVHLAGLGSWDLSGAAYTYGQPSAAPPTVACNEPIFLGCPYGCMSSPYSMSWVGSTTAVSYKVQRKDIYGSWQPWYTGTYPSVIGSTGTVYPEYFRVQALNALGQGGGYCHMTLNVQCSETMDPW